MPSATFDPTGRGKAPPIEADRSSRSGTQRESPRHPRDRRTMSSDTGGPTRLDKSRVPKQFKTAARTPPPNF
jgi:hypothetical protein